MTAGVEINVSRLSLLVKAQEQDKYHPSGFRSGTSLTGDCNFEVGTKTNRCGNPYHSLPLLSKGFENSDKGYWQIIGIQYDHALTKTILVGERSVEEGGRALSYFISKKLQSASRKAANNEPQHRFWSEEVH
ncbi:hypothetical protein CC1G_15532 [Coprinopsis cinerea okayama7|uniref:Uncharacterized protein n=1 Tax=Coprinopsis cinerea (strain Okayama-7 / 130 / ATCC MYA-4618 / FGSC 9003) TaxID=240176 RepID=D6RN20_COPC7|nr:hypothetical protein CC1G_15532 [Coprinopsis cinerea okayama7\|eukprot:XP_002910991.1 hypothetical protein CC1G_15532 [Coprinopsis cinerea okayama7\